MRRVLLPLLVMAMVAAMSACTGAGVGDPCTPGHPGLPEGGVQCPSANLPPNSDCFQQSEIYIETTSLQCRTRVCMVYKWDERGAPEQESQRVFCTCRCGGQGDPALFCQCPSGFACTTAFVAGAVGIRGSYCVRCEALNAGGGCDGG